MSIKYWRWVFACGLLVCATAVAGGPLLEDLGRHARGAALALADAQAPMLEDGGFAGGGVLVAVALLQLAGIVGFEAWALSWRRAARSGRIVGSAR